MNGRWIISKGRWGFTYLFCYVNIFPSLKAETVKGVSCELLPQKP